MLAHIPAHLKPAAAFCFGTILAAIVILVESPLPLKIVAVGTAFCAAFPLIGRWNLLKMAAAFLLALTSAFLITEKESELAALPDNCGVTAVLEIRDFSCAGEDIEWLPNPYHIIAVLREIKFSDSDKMPIALNQKVALTIKDRKIKPKYGDQIAVRGCLSRPSGALFDGDFDWREFLLSKKISYVLDAKKISITGHKSSITSALLSARNWMLNAITEKISDNENRQIIAGIIFGCRQGISPDTNKKLMMSGTIHIIAISGMHTAVLALFLFIIFSWLPFRIRYLIVPILVFIYVYSTGMPSSALRALLMIAIWSWQTAALYPSSSYSAILYAAAISLIINPFGILDSGFQYSFIITAFLIAGWNGAGEISRLFDIKGRFSEETSALVHFKRSVFSGVLKSVILCSTAFLAGIQVSVFQQNVFNPMSILVNLFLSPFLWLLFADSLICLLFPVKITSVILDASVSALKWTAMSFSDSAINIATPPLLPFLAAFSLPLAILVFRKNGRAFNLLLIISIFSSLTFCFILPLLRPDTLILISGYGKPVSAIAVSSRRDSVNIINVSTPDHARKIAEFLSSNGYWKIDRIYCSESLMDSTAGIPFLLSKFQCGNLVFMSNPALSRYSKNACDKAGKNETKVKIINTVINQKTRGKIFKTEIHLPGQNTVLEMERLPSGDTIVGYRYGETSFNVLTQNHLNLKFNEIDTEFAVE
jgi:ComEC/Rec2-related protein